MNVDTLIDQPLEVKQHIIKTIFVFIESFNTLTDCNNKVIVLTNMFQYILDNDICNNPHFKSFIDVIPKKIVEFREELSTNIAYLDYDIITRFNGLMYRLESIMNILSYSGRKCDIDTYPDIKLTHI